MGARAMIYAGEALSHPELFTIAGIVDINQERVLAAQQLFHVPDSHCFRTVEELTAVPKCFYPNAATIWISWPG